ncbi:MAG: hypothetical protein QOD60_2476 [Solirubrobacterales bacterium]|jgi:hypothetical protein|nr:hypothetical protein [Solirubrobacterales bacterium]
MLAACGSSDPATQSGAGAAAFGWLAPSAPPRAWAAARLPAGPSVLAHPTSWRAIKTDAGTVSVARKSNGQITGYLNVTPQSGDETLANWPAFRAAHNREEGDEDVTQSAAATGLAFRDAKGSCVIDDYSTTTNRRYREIACIVEGPSATTVVVGAAPPRLWQGTAPVLERAISGFSAG